MTRAFSLQGRHFTHREPFVRVLTLRPRTHPNPSLPLSSLCVRKSSLPRGLSVIMLMGNKEIILNGTLISSLLPLPSA